MEISNDTSSRTGKDYPCNNQHRKRRQHNQHIFLKNMYSLEIYKKKINTVFAEIDTNKNTQSEHQNFEISLFVIIFVNSIVILFTFWLIFHKKKIR